MTLFTKIKTKSFIFLGFILILVLLVSSPFILNWSVNTSYIKNKISLAISQKTGADFKASRFSITLFPKLGISVEDFIFNPDAETDINIKAINFNLDIRKLLSGKICVTHVSLVRPELNTKSSGKSQSLSNSAFSNLNSLPQLIVAIKKLFTLLPEHQGSVEFEFKDVRTPYFNRMDGSFYLSKENNHIILNTIIDKIAFKASEIFDVGFKKYSDLDSIKINKLDCLININSQGEIKGECKFAKLNIKSNSDQLLVDINNIDSSFKISENLYQIDIKPFKLNYPEAMIEVGFQDNLIQEKSRLQIRGTDIKVDQARQMSLLMLKDNEITDYIFEIIHKGFVPKIDVSFNGKDLDDLFNENNFELKGNINNSLIHIPETSLKASSADGSASIKKGVLNINTNKAVINGSKLKKGNLVIDLLNYTDFPFHGEFALDIDLSKIPQTLISLLPDTLLSKELLLVHDVTGRADARLSISMETQSDDLKVTVHTDDFQVSGLYDRIPGNINLKNINFIYEPDMVHLKKINGIVKGCNIDHLEMFLDFKDEANIQVVSGSGVINLDSLMPWVMSFKKTNNSISPAKKLNGKIHIASMDLSGPLFKADKWQYDLKGAGADIDITTNSDQKEIKNLSCEYHISDDFFNFSKIQLTMDGLSWLAPFIDKKYFDTILLPFDMHNGKLQIRPKNSFLRSDLKFSTGLNINIYLIGETLDTLTLNSIKFHDQDISKGIITFNKTQNKSLFDFNGFFNTTTLNKLIKPDSHWSNRLNTITDGQPIIISMDNKSDLNITSKSINMNSMDTRSEKTPLDYNLLPSKIINFKTDQLKIKDLTFTNIDSKIFLKEDGPYIKLKKAFLCNLETSGYIDFRKDNINCKLPVKAYNKANIQDLLSCLSQKDKLIDGQYSLDCDLSSKGSQKEVSKKIKGSIKFNAEQGRIYKLTLLSRILSVINVSKFFKGSIPDVEQQGFGYKKIIIEADIQGSIIYLTRAIIDGEDMTLVFTGWIDPLNDTMDLTCLVAPFKTVDLIIEKIPIINTILEGRSVSIPAKASGKLSDPVVVPIHPSAVGKGLLNMMTNILKTPVKLWDKIDGE
ncbi:MAG: AsmA-like C-terminal domain-containing protein [Thermodesulfobacteriota bacterium]